MAGRGFILKVRDKWRRISRREGGRFPLTSDEAGDPLSHLLRDSQSVRGGGQVIKSADLHLSLFIMTLILHIYVYFVFFIKNEY